ncbi:hypothetical protein [Nocardia sp. NPDC051750]|uniref:hypothetical protein n=1 Tax=Nocardia sp. NPDC051750 TaxID=3364325 RepID=UPI00378943AA
MHRELPAIPGRHADHRCDKAINTAADCIGHTAATLAIGAVANIEAVQRMPGQETATLTLDLYGHLFPDDPDTAAAGMEAGARAAADQLQTA